MDSFYQSGFRPVKAGSRAAARPEGRRRGRPGRAGWQSQEPGAAARGAAATERGLFARRRLRRARSRGCGRAFRAQEASPRGASGAGAADERQRGGKLRRRRAAP
ncbi:hypothetical protein ACTHPH_07945, partial [Paenibacillus pasadenensis]